MPELAPQRFCLEDFPPREPGPQPLSVNPLDPLDIKSGRNLWFLCTTVEELVGTKEATEMSKRQGYSGIAQSLGALHPRSHYPS